MRTITQTRVSSSSPTTRSLSASIQRAACLLSSGIRCAALCQPLQRTESASWTSNIPFSQKNRPMLSSLSKSPIQSYSPTGIMCPDSTLRMRIQIQIQVPETPSVPRFLFVYHSPKPPPAEAPPFWHRYLRSIFLAGER